MKNKDLFHKKKKFNKSLKDIKDINLPNINKSKKKKKNSIINRQILSDIL